MAFWEMILALLAAVGLSAILWELWKVLRSPGPEENNTYALLPASGTGEDLEHRVRRLRGLPEMPRILLLDIGLNEEGQQRAYLLTIQYFGVELCTPETLLSYIQ